MFQSRTWPIWGALALFVFACAVTKGTNETNNGGAAGGTGGTHGSGGTTAGGSGGAASSARDARCEGNGLAWRTGAKTNFESYPTNPTECIQFSGCNYIGKFSVCGDVVHQIAWVMSHNIVAAFPQGNLGLHDLCLRSGAKTIVVTVLDTCADSDCNGCCTTNKGNADLLIDVESFTDLRWGVGDGPIEWADLGTTKGNGCK